MSGMSADMRADAIRRAHGDIPAAHAVTCTRPGGVLASAANLAIELPPPDSTRPRARTGRLPGWLPAPATSPPGC